MYHTTGLVHDDIVDLCARIHAYAQQRETPVNHPPMLGLFVAVCITLTYLRRNRVQAEIAESYGASQSTISRCISAITPLIAACLTKLTPTAEDLVDGKQYIVDGTLAPCWSWRAHPELYSGKHKTTGLNLQVVCDLDRQLAWISDPVDGSRHDVAALREHRVLDGVDPAEWFGDKGYVGTGMTTPIKKPVHRDLLECEEKFNTGINGIRWAIEQAIANLKTWRILHTDYRRPLETFATTISAVIGLHFYRLGAE
jgi:hypothetical protein